MISTTKQERNKREDKKSPHKRNPKVREISKI